jgi:hypothetical protein
MNNQSYLHGGPLHNHVRPETHKSQLVVEVFVEPLYWLSDAAKAHSEQAVYRRRVGSDHFDFVGYAGDIDSYGCATP